LSGLRTEHTGDAREIWVLIALEVTLRQRAGGRLEQLRKAGEHIAEQAGDPQRHIDARSSELCQGNDLESCQPA
jgi:hypothetical protein